MTLNDFTIIRSKGSCSLYAFTGRLTLEEAARMGGLDPQRVELVKHEYGQVLKNVDEESLLRLASIMFQRGAEWARDHMRKELGG